jgi:hypothetical protein
MVLRPGRIFRTEVRSPASSQRSLAVRATIEPLLAHFGNRYVRMRYALVALPATRDLPSGHRDALIASSLAATVC